MRNYKTEGIVIKRRDAGEADRLLTIFTPRYGKLSIKAPGVRKITSRRSSHIEPFTHSLFTLYKGKAAPIATEVQTINHFAPLRIDLEKVGYAYHVCELIDGLCPDSQEQPGVFSLLKETLERIGSETLCLDAVATFEKQLLAMLGFTTPLAAETDTTAFIEQLLERRLKTRRMLYRFR